MSREIVKKQYLYGRIIGHVLAVITIVIFGYNAMTISTTKSLNPATSIIWAIALAGWFVVIPLIRFLAIEDNLSDNPSAYQKMQQKWNIYATEHYALIIFIVIFLYYILDSTAFIIISPT
ncbi:MAG: hypothetical protein L3J71_16980 [Victivallaceae bacterium]|nr:hypothetical protein [Victivallaceae bacterium]